MNATASRSDLAPGAILASGGAGIVALRRLEDPFEALIGRNLGRSVLSESGNAVATDVGLFADEARARNIKAAREQLESVGSDGWESQNEAVSVVPAEAIVAPVREQVLSQPANRPGERSQGGHPVDQSRVVPAPDRPQSAPHLPSDHQASASGPGAQHQPTEAQASVTGASSARVSAGGSNAGTGVAGVRAVASASPATSGGIHGPGPARSEGNGRLTRTPHPRPSFWKPEQGEFSRQLERGIQAVLRQQGGSVTMRLRPDSLGDLRIQLNLSGGDVTARFDAREESARRLLEQSVDQLRSALEARGLRVGRIEIASPEQGDARMAHDAPSERREASTGGAGQNEERAAQDAPHRESRGRHDQDAGRTGPSAWRPTDNSHQSETGTLDGWGVSALGGAGVGLHIVMRIDTLA